MEMQARAAPQAKRNALVGAVLVGTVAIVIAAIVSVTGETSTTSTWPTDVRQYTAPSEEQVLADIRAGEKALITPAQAMAVEPQALADIRAGEKELITPTQVKAVVDKALITIRAAEREGR